MLRFETIITMGCIKEMEAAIASAAEQDNTNAFQLIKTLLYKPEELKKAGCAPGFRSKFQCINGILVAYYTRAAGSEYIMLEVYNESAEKVSFVLNNHGLEAIIKPNLNLDFNGISLDLPSYYSSPKESFIAGIVPLSRWLQKTKLSHEIGRYPFDLTLKVNPLFPQNF